MFGLPRAPLSQCYARAAPQISHAMANRKESTRVIVLMGVSGCGKSTIGKLLAERIGGSFHDGDDFHPVENIEKMSAGIGLCDDDRKGWLEGIAHAFSEWDGNNIHVLACSALRQAYRDVLETGGADLQFVLLNGEADLIRERLQVRRGHFMGSDLLESQIALLEPPKDALVVDINEPTGSIVSRIESSLCLHKSA